MPEPDLESMLRYWNNITKPLEETPRRVLNALYQREVERARRLRQPQVRGGGAGITQVDWTRWATEALGEPAEALTETLIRQGYVSIRTQGCVLQCDGYDVFESRNLIYSKLMFGLCYLTVERQQTQVGLTVLADFSGINVNAAGHYTKCLEHQSLVRKETLQDSTTLKFKTYVRLTELGQRFMEYFNSDRAAAYKSPLLPAWQAEIKEVLASQVRHI